MSSIDVLAKLANLGLSKGSFSISLVDYSYGTHFKITVGDFSHIVPTLSSTEALLDAYVSITARYGVKEGWISQG